jgi:hypothetical protein
MNPYVVMNNDIKPIKRINLSDVKKIMQGKSIRVNDETVHYDELKH